jgi:hypothetical protein
VRQRRNFLADIPFGGLQHRDVSCRLLLLRGELLDNAPDSGLRWFRGGSFTASAMRQVFIVKKMLMILAV